MTNFQDAPSKGPDPPGTFSDRTGIILGEHGLHALAEARVAVYGLGGVGAACALDLVRVGVGHLHVVDFDTVEASNLNRLSFGFQRYIGQAKTDAFIDAAKEINSSIDIVGEKFFFSNDTASGSIARECSVHADCVDSLGPKASLIAAMRRENLFFISSMGTAGRLMPERLRLGPMASVRGCPLARAVRQKLSKMRIPLDFPVVWSDEPAVKPLPQERRRGIQGSTPFVPQTAGHFMASWIVRKLLEDAHV
jgi:tRNA A37 threonylcarbamoyladenosine dehydratase